MIPQCICNQILGNYHGSKGTLGESESLREHWNDLRVLDN
jgi:hypothetical protein